MYGSIDCHFASERLAHKVSTGVVFERRGVEDEIKSLESGCQSHVYESLLFLIIVYVHNLQLYMFIYIYLGTIMMLCL